MSDRQVKQRLWEIQGRLAQCKGPVIDSQEAVVRLIDRDVPWLLDALIATAKARSACSDDNLGTDWRRYVVTPRE
jgi:tellurite resistance protein